MNLDLTELFQHFPKFLKIFQPKIGQWPFYSIYRFAENLKIDGPFKMHVSNRFNLQKSNALELHRRDSCCALLCLALNF